ncbi:MAG TPA: AAA family ATPase [Actinomycetota bacterium]|nr:AAA family ATPase [Actinomycetota bacterium]
MGEAGAPVRAPDLLLIVGPPAVGKMSVGREIALRTGYRLFHNHMSIEPVLQFFDYGHPSFGRLVEGFRRSVFEEVAQSDLPGLIFTFVWAFNLPSEADALEERTRPFRSRGGRVRFLELQAPLEERLRRNEHELRLAEKPSKRDVARSRDVLLQHEAQYEFKAPNEFTQRDDWLRVDNTTLSPEEVAVAAIKHFDLPETQQ